MSLTSKYMRTELQEEGNSQLGVQGLGFRAGFKVELGFRVVGGSTRPSCSSGGRRWFPRSECMRSAATLRARCRGYLEEISQHFAANVDAAYAAGVWLAENERHHVCI